MEFSTEGGVFVFSRGSQKSHKIFFGHFCGHVEIKDQKEDTEDMGEGVRM